MGHARGLAGLRMIPPGADHYWGADLDLDSDDPDAVEPHPDAIFDDEHNSRMAAWSNDQ